MVFRFHFCFGMAFTSGSFYLYLFYTGRTAFPHLPEWPGECTGNASFRTVSVDPTLRYNRSAGGFPDRDIPLYSVRAVPPFRYHFIVFIIYEYPKRYKACRKMFGGTDRNEGYLFTPEMPERYLFWGRLLWYDGIRTKKNFSGRDER